MRDLMRLIEGWDKTARVAHGLRYWDDVASDHRYPWGPRGDNQRGMTIKIKAMKWAEKNLTQPATVRYADLIAIEPSVYPERIKHYMNMPDHELPFVFKFYDMMVLWDGTHRVAAAMQQGQSEGRVLVCDLDSILDRDGHVRDPK